ncbi:MAG: ABC transporter substrate-binding protein [Candidatus Hermodarchaeota archaeon]
MKKSNLNTIVLFILILFFGIQGVFVLNSSVTGKVPNEKLKMSQPTSIVIGVIMGPFSIDPHDAWDHGSFNVIEQVCEGLFAYNLSHPNKEIIPRLASDFGTWSIDGLNYTVTLRQNILFHDGSSFNSTAVKWNFDRLAYLTNTTGELPSSSVKASHSSLYRWFDGTPFINRTEIIDSHTIKFILNKPFGGFEALLCFSGSYIISPLSTPPITFIDVNSGDLIGTGPFVYDNYITDTEVNFHAFDEYWRTNSTTKDLKLKIIQDSFSLTRALIDGDVDMLINPSHLYFNNITNSPNLNLTESSKGSWVLFYLGINNHLINQTYREAISYALNYSYFTDYLYGGYVERLKSPIPKGMLYSNYSYNVPIFNLTKARIVMQSMGYGDSWDVTPGGIHESNWESANFRTLNYTYIIGSSTQKALGEEIKDNFGKIGITVELYNSTWIEMILKFYEESGFSRDMLELFFIGWGADYNDPSQILNILLSNSTYAFNFAQYNGGYGGFKPYSQENDVELLMEQAISSTNKDERRQLYNKIQELIIERDFPWAFGITPKSYIAYHKDIEGIEENAFVSADEEGASSLKGDFQLLSWKYTPSPGGISGYETILISFIALISVVYIMKYKIFKNKN